MTYFQQSAKVSSRQNFWPYGISYIDAMFVNMKPYKLLYTENDTVMPQRKQLVWLVSLTLADVI